MNVCLNEKEPCSLPDLDPHDFFENFEKYIEIKFQDPPSTKSKPLPIKLNIARNLKKEFDFEFLQPEDIDLKSEPLRKIENDSKTKPRDIHNFFCLCFVCQTKKFIQKRRSSSIRLTDKNTIIGNPTLANKENIEKDKNESTKPTKKSFIVKKPIKPQKR